MFKLIRRHQKKILAFFGILLMLTFLGNRGTNGGNDAADRVVGHLNGKAILNSDVGEARSELLTIEHFTAMRTGADTSASLLSLMFGRPRANQFEEKPDLFFLLRDEARKSGVTISSAELDRIMAEAYQGPASGTDEYAATRAAITDLLMVNQRFTQLQSDVNLSRPAMNHVLAGEHETIGINIVQLQTADYASRVPAPTTQQVWDQFKKFADVSPGTVQPGTNAFGFGYKLPIRAQAQYFSISPKSLDDAAFTAGPSGVPRPPGWTLDQWWDLAGQKYYHSHLEDFRESPPADSTTQPATPLPIKTYAKVRDEVLGDIRKPITEKLGEEIKSYVNTAMINGWQIYRQFASATPAPSTEPVAGFGEQYSSFRFMQNVANQVLSRFNVIVIAHDTSRPIPLQAITRDPELANYQVANFISTQADAYLASPDPKSLAATAQLLRSSTPIQITGTDPIVVIRLVGVLPSESPKDIAAVQTIIEADLRSAAGYELARADAQILLTAANKGTLTQAATLMGRTVVSTDPMFPLSRMHGQDVKTKPTDVVFPPLGNAETEFTRVAFGLLGNYDPKTNPNPATLIELPPQGRLFVTQVKNVNVDWNSENYYTTVLRMRRAVAQELLPQLAAKWFDYAEVVQRTGYKSAKTTSGG